MDSACLHLFSYSVNLPPRHTGPPLSLPATPQVRYPCLLLSMSKSMLISAQEERRGGLCLQLPLGRPPPSPLPALPSPSLPRPLPQTQSGGIGKDQQRVMAVVMRENGHCAAEQILGWVSTIQQWSLEGPLVRQHQPGDQALGFRRLPGC